MSPISVSSAAEVLEAERATYVDRTPKSAEQFKRRLNAFPGGDTRLVTFYPPHPAQIERATGIDMEDLDGNHYADFLQNYTSMITGHRHPAVMEAAIEMMGQLTGAAAPVPNQLELAEEIIRRVDSIERIRFTNSGTEAMTIGTWAARAFTGRPWLLKTIGGYHGCIPELDRSIRDRSFPPGVPEVTPVKSVPYNNVEALTQAAESIGSELAAIILEPVMGSGGVIPPAPGYLEAARGLADATGALLIFDEVISYRLGYGGYQERLSIKPDLTAIAKIIGGGFPVGALGGRADVMEVFRPGGERSISHSGTFNGNPIMATAGLKVLELLDREAFDRLDRMGAQLADGLRGAIHETGVAAQVTNVGSIGNVHFSSEPIYDFDTAQLSDATMSAAFHVGLLNRGIFIAPRGMWAVATVATEDDIGRFVVAARDVFQALA